MIDLDAIRKETAELQERVDRKNPGPFTGAVVGRLIRHIETLIAELEELRGQLPDWRS